MTGKRPILEVIEDYDVELTKQEDYFVALCPFHDDKNPSFTVYLNDSDDNSRWHCWTCDPEGGDVIDFVKKIENISFDEAKKIACDYSSDYDLLVKEIASRFKPKSDNLDLLLDLQDTLRGILISGEIEVFNNKLKQVMEELKSKSPYLKYNIKRILAS